MDIDRRYPVAAGVEMPSHKQKKTSLYGFERLDIGDSFPVDRSEVLKVRASAYTHGKATGKKFSVRFIEYDDGTSEWRCWRIALPKEKK